jgi:predicted dinucleotide-binding enzyme
MNIGIIGAGNLGTGLAKQLLKKNHTILLSFSKDAGQLKDSARALGATAGTPADAATFAEVIVLATPWTATAEALRQVGAVTGKKILWDCTNALKPDMSGLSIGTNTSAGEQVSSLAPWARVVKAIPPFAELLHSPSVLLNGARSAVFVCADDTDARRVVADLVRDIGAEPVDAGALALARYTEPTGMLLVQLAYVRGLGSRIGLSLVRDAPASETHG